MVPLGNLGDEVTLLNDSQAATLISIFETKIGQTLVEGCRGNHQVKSLAPAWYVTILNFSFPTQAHWDTLIELLLDPMVAWTDKHQASWLIARKPDRVPPSIRATLVANIPAITASAVAGIDTNPMMGSLGTVLAITLGALQGAEADIEATKLVCGSAPEREDAARLLGLNYCPNLRPTLAGLIGDTQPDVRWEAENLSVGCWSQIPAH